MDPRCKFFYLVPHLTQDMSNASPLGWYTTGLHAAADPLILASRLPADIREPFTQLDVMLAHRQLRHVWPHVTPITIEAVQEASNVIPSPFQVYITNDPHVADATDLALSASRFPYLHVSTEPGPGRVPRNGFNNDRLIDYVYSVLDVLETNEDWSDFVRNIRPELEPAKRRLFVPSPIPSGGHNLVLPNEMALQAFGRTFDSTDFLAQTSNLETYVERICQSINVVIEAREQILDSFSDHRYLIALPGHYWGYHNHWQRIAASLGGVNQRLLKIWLRAVVHASAYVDLIPMETDDEATLRDYAKFNTSRALDVRSFTAGLCILASPTLVPTFRLEPRLNQCRGNLKQLAIFVRKPGPKHRQWKQSRLARQLGEKMRTLIAQPYLDLIDRPSVRGEIEGLKLVGDIPIELLPSNGLSLSMRFDVSRIPAMPGNAFIASCVATPVTLEYSSFSEVLIVRSFSDTDPIRNILEQALLDGSASIRTPVRIVDVDSVQGFVDVISAFEGACLVIDCHGYYDAETGAGNLVIGGDRIDMWLLKGRCDFPPIVIFSACDTQPIDGSHSSTATAAFSLGARTVLATSLPIEAPEAAIFVRRLLHRIREFIPIALRHSHQISWREVVSGMLRMTHVSEIMLTLSRVQKVPLTAVVWRRAQYAANKAINSRQDSWFDLFLEAYSDCTGVPVQKLRELISSFAAMTESMKYIQLGSPENILIVRERADKTLANG